MSRTLTPIVAIGALLVAAAWAAFGSLTFRNCPPDAVLDVPRGFCAVVFAEGLPKPRHLVVSPAGDVIVAFGGGITPASRGGIAILRDSDGDGRADAVRRFHGAPGNDVELHDGHLYFSSDDEVVRYPYDTGALALGSPETIVRGLPAAGSHKAKSIVVSGDDLYVSIGAPTNLCGAGGVHPDPCPVLDSTAGIWRFSASRSGQSLRDGSRFATGLRHTVAFAADAAGDLHGVVHGANHLADPGEEFVRIEQDADFGWPYCYYSLAERAKVLTPEYGGDGKRVGICDSVDQPLLAFPAHWAPNGLLFHSGTGLPTGYARGAFVAFHGSMYRRGEQDGFNVVFVPYRAGFADASWEVFADGFAEKAGGPGDAAHRPVGLAEGPDGSLYVSDDQGGRIFRIYAVRP